MLGNVAPASRRLCESERMAVAHVHDFCVFVPLSVTVALEQADATIPAQNAIIISLRPEGLSLVEAAQRLFQRHQQSVRRASRGKLRLDAALVQDSCVVQALIFVGE